jgi:hypothetical protein
MKLFKSFLVAAMAVVISGFAFNTQAHAQQSDNGSAVENTYGSTGNNVTGGDNKTGGTATYVTPSSSGPVSGYANDAGAGVSYVHVSGPINTSTSTSTFSFNVGAVGSQSTISINGFAGQGNWVTAPSPSNGNYADGGDGTGATLIGSSSADGTQTDPLTGSGDAMAKGKTVASVNVAQGGLSATSTAQTIGSSNGTGTLNGNTPQLATTATGAGGIEGGALVAGPNNSGAEGNFAANMQYGATNPSASTAGSLQAHGVTNTTVSSGGNAASASTTVLSQAQAH